MSLFQESIIRKHLGYLDQDLVDQAYLRFKKVYSANKISNIKIANEEQYQEGFIKDIFGEVLGYSVFPDQPFIVKANLILALNVEFREFIKKFQRSLERKFALTELPKKLQDWYMLSYADFIKELGKKKIKLSLSEEAEWEMYFTSEAKKALELKAQIEKTDKEIDQMVYALYELTEDEIKIVEAS